MMKNKKGNLKMMTMVINQKKMMKRRALKDAMGTMDGVMKQ